ncbi:unnamed protein product [Trifolium pratense]|uniref:Uncharacterized protein n=1 Tax=Trifolium pratense TaxID=57577 RepID=A0ACB0KZ14_TRIPR|nr:unnamed protein product [Trifolium pratense]
MFVNDNDVVVEVEDMKRIELRMMMKNSYPKDLFNHSQIFIDSFLFDQTQARTRILSNSFNFSFNLRNSASASFNQASDSFFAEIRSNIQLLLQIRALFIQSNFKIQG